MSSIQERRQPQPTGSKLPDQYAHLSAVELIRGGIEIEREERIKLDQVLRNTLLFDPDHAQELSTSMMRKRGQLTPISVRARLDERGSIVYDIIDGFHRTEGRRLSGHDDIKATVLYGCSDEEMTDLRIVAAGSVRTVQFARIAILMKQAYALTPWSESDLTVSEAFGLGLKKPKLPSHVELTKEEREEIGRWAQEKAKMWGKTTASVHNILEIVEKADPELVNQVRDVAGGNTRTDQMTSAVLALVAEAYPGEKNFGIQARLLKVITERQMHATEADDFLISVGPHLHADTSIDTIRKIADNTLAVAPPTSDADVKIDKNSGNGNGHKSGKQTVYKSPSAPKPSKQDTFNTNIELRELRTKVAQLTAKVEDLSSKPENADRTDAWWRTAPFVSEEERIVLERILYANQTFEIIARETHIPTARIQSLLLSALRKRSFNHARLTPQLGQ